MFVCLFSRFQPESAALSAALALGFAPGAFAQSSGENAAQPVEQQKEAAATGLWERANLLGEMGGLRPWLAQYGLTFTAQESSEYMGNVTGGTRRGGAYQGLAQFALSLDTQKGFGSPGGTFNVSALQIHGTSLSARNLQTLQSASGIEADAATRLWELWYQQALPGGKTDVKVGLQSADQEFMVSQNANAFMNATFGWPVLPSADLPAGGPAYPLASLGVRMRATAAEGVTLLGGVFDGNPAPGEGDPQKLNASGTNFHLGNGALVIGEIQYAINPPQANASESKANGLPGVYKLGFWYDSNRFSDPALGAASQRGNYSVYALADQTVWRAGEDSPRSIGVFARAMGAPGDRNLVDLALNAGVTLKAPFAGRDNDVAGLAIGYAHIGAHAQDYAASQTASTPGYPLRSAETVLEATYQYQLAPWWQWQADFQYVFRPAGGIPDPQNPSRRIGDEAVLGVRTTIQF